MDARRRLEKRHSSSDLSREEEEEGSGRVQGFSRGERGEGIERITSAFFFFFHCRAVVRAIVRAISQIEAVRVKFTEDLEKKGWGKFRPGAGD